MLSDRLFAGAVISLVLGACRAESTVTDPVRSPPAATQVPEADESKETVGYVQSQQDEPSRIGPIHIGMTEADVRELGVPFRTQVKTIMDQDVVFWHAEISGSVEVEILFGNQEEVMQVSTSSPDYTTEEGASVGFTLGRLKEIYPEGRILSGWADGRYLMFSTGTAGQYFIFDPYGLEKPCISEPSLCTDTLDALESVEFRVG